MLNIISILIGIVTLIMAIVAFLPIVAIANWIIVPLAAVGAGIGALSESKSGRNLCVIVMILGIGRLILGGGII